MTETNLLKGTGGADVLLMTVAADTMRVSAHMLMPAGCFSEAAVTGHLRMSADTRPGLATLIVVYGDDNTIARKIAAETQVLIQEMGLRYSMEVRFMEREPGDPPPREVGFNVNGRCLEA